MTRKSGLEPEALLTGFFDRTVLALGVTQTIGYGTLYYAYGVLAPAISREFSVSLDWFFGAFTLGLLFGGLVAPVVGRELDRRGARPIMTFGSMVAAAALLACALAPDLWSFGLAIVLAEAAACFVLYEAAFAGLTQMYRHEARRSITAVTLMAGFASTLFWPLTQMMLSNLDWRWTLAIFALLNLGVCAPLHAMALKQAKPHPRESSVGSAIDPSEPPILLGADRRRAVLFYTGAIVISGLVYAAFPIHMLRIIENEGFSADQAAMIAMVMGPAQVLSRILEFFGGQRFDPLMTGRVALGALLAAIMLLVLTPGSAVTALIFAGLYGAAQGLMTIARATVPLQLFGPRGYATLVGKVTGLRFLTNAASPFLFALAMTHLSVEFALWTSAAAALLALGAFLTLTPPRHS